MEENLEFIFSIEAQIKNHDPRLLTSAYKQIRFFLARTYAYFESHLDTLRNFMVREIHHPTIIFQRMVCSVIDRDSYAGVLYSRHPRLGTGVLLQFARTIYGEDLMTGRLPAEEKHFHSREETRKEFPAVYHFWNRLSQLEEIFRSPVMVEFTGVHGRFTILQVNPAELTGSGMITAVMDMHRSGKISMERVRELIKPYHVRQIESDSVDPKSPVNRKGEMIREGDWVTVSSRGKTIFMGKAVFAPALVSQCLDINREKLVARLLEVTLGTHLMNLAAYEPLTPDRRVRLLRDALALCRERGISGYQAGAFVIGSLVRPDSPGTFWASFSPVEIGGLLNEWVLHQKYMNILNDVGERRISRARTFILSKGLGSLPLHYGMLKDFMPLKLSRIGLAEVRRSLPANHDPQTVEVLDLLSQPFGKFYDYSDPGSLARLKKICDLGRVPLPGPEDI